MELEFLKPSKRNLHFQGAKYGIVSAVVGCAVFVLMIQVRLVLLFGFESFDSKVDLEIAILIFVFGSILASMASLVSSNLLTWILDKEAYRDKLTFLVGIRWGIFIGAITGVGVSIFGLILTNGKGSENTYILYTTIVIIISSISGGWTGKKLTKYLFSHKEIE